MSYICKGNIPKNCSKCPQRTLYHGINVCLAADKMKVSTSNKSRHENCPLVEIPTPHGRLIDADELIKSLREGFCGERCIRNHDCFSCGIDGYIRIMENEPTVIGASE